MALPPGFQQSLLITFKITLDTILGKLVFEDTSQAIYTQNGITNMKGLLWITHSTQGLVYVNSGYQTNNFSSPDTSTGSLTKQVDFTLAKGTYTINYKVHDGTNQTTITKSYDFQYDNPSMKVSYDVNYDISKITILDESTYAIGVGRTFTPINIVRDVHIRPPLGSPMLPYQDSNSLPEFSIGPNIYTGSYDISVESEVTYNLASWGSNVWVTWITEVSNYITFNVEQSQDCVQNCLPCIYQLSEKAVTARSQSAREADYYDTLIHDIAFYYGMYAMYKSAGLDPAYACDKIKNILRRECNIDTTPSSTPVEIIPLYDISGSSTVITGTQWFSGQSVPSQNLGNNGDYYLKTNNGFVYNKVGGIWSHIMTLSVKGQRLIKTVYQNYSVSLFDDIIFATSMTPPGLAVTMPGNALEGTEFTVVASALVHPVAVIPNSQGFTVNGSASYVFGTAGDSVTFVLYGNDWKII